MRKNPLLMIPLEQYQLQDQQPIGDQLVEAAANALYGRSVPTAPGCGDISPRFQRVGMGRVQVGTQSLMARMAVDHVAHYPVRLFVHRLFLVDMLMSKAINRSVNQSFDEAVDSFNKQARKFRKRL